MDVESQAFFMTVPLAMLPRRGPKMQAATFVHLHICMRAYLCMYVHRSTEDVPVIRTSWESSTTELAKINVLSHDAGYTMPHKHTDPAFHSTPCCPYLC